MNYELFLGVPAIAVGLSALSLLVASQRMPLQSLTRPAIIKIQNLKISELQSFGFLSF